MEEKELNSGGEEPEKAGEQELFGRFCAGDNRAFADILKKYRSKALNFAYRYLGDMDDAEDAAQECFVKLYRSRKSFEIGRPFEPWFYRILANCCRDRIRHQNRFTDFVERFSVEKKAETQAFSHNPGHYSEALAAALLRLSQDKREVIALRFDQELSYEDIARALNISEGTVMSRLHRAKKELERILKSMGLK